MVILLLLMLLDGPRAGAAAVGAEGAGEGGKKEEEGGGEGGWGVFRGEAWGKGTGCKTVKELDAATFFGRGGEVIPPSLPPSPSPFFSPPPT